MSVVPPQRMGKTKEKGPKTQPIVQIKTPPEGTKAPDNVNPKIQPTAEQMRIAQIVNEVNKLDPDLKEKVEQVMELTGKSNDEAVVALHDCDDDFATAVMMLLDGKQNEGEWELSGKKKKNRQTTAVKSSEADGTDASPSNKENRAQGERSRNRDSKPREGSRNRGGPPRMNRGGSGRKWRNKESEKNERNLEERQGSEGRHRGGGGGRRGRGKGSNKSRTFQNRDSFPQSIDTWTNSTAEQADANNAPMTVGNWSDLPSTEDWSEEDWAESLTETKVFTPSALPELPNNTASELGQRLDLATLLQQASARSEIQSNNLSSESVISENQSQVDRNQYRYTQFAKQAAETIKAAVGVGSVLNGSNVSHGASSVSASYQCNFSAASPLSNGQSPLNRNVDQQCGNSVHIANSTQCLSARCGTQKARISPSSKIPESAVEMPDDAIQQLDVQFGALEFGTDSIPFDFNSSEQSSNYPDNHNSQSTGGCQNSQTQTAIPLNKDANYAIVTHATDVTANGTSHGSVDKDHSSSLVEASKVTGSDSLLLTSQKERREISGISSYASLSGQTNSLDGPLENSSDSQSLNSYSGHRSNSSGYSSQYSGQKSSVLNSSNLTPSNNSYSNSALSSLNNQQQNNYVSIPQTQNYPSVSTSYVMGQSVYSGSTQSSGNSSYHGSQNAYNSHNVSGYNVSNFANQQGYSNSATANSQASLHSSISSKIANSLSHGVRDVQHNATQHSFDLTNVTTSALNVPPLTSVVVSSSCAGLIATSPLGLNNSSSTTTTSVLKNSLPATGKVMPNIPPGVPAMVGHQYIMGQAGLPFYGYYDMQFQASTSMAGRDPNVGNVAYTVADVKYSRGEAEVSTALSQGQSTQPHGQPFINPTPLPPGYGYYFPGGVMAGSIHHYAPPPMFPVSPATNAHGASPNAQFQKPTGYGSHSYGTVGYESLTQAQDFTKGTYGSGNQSQGKGVSGSPDIAGTVYTKSHAQLAKSYDKPGFHTGTPPPFNLATGQTTGPLGVSSAPYAATPFIPVLTHGQHHSTLLHHHLQDSGHPSAGPQRNALSQQKGPGGNKQNFAYWGTN